MHPTTLGLGLLLGTLTSLAQASGLDQLHAFLEGTRTARGTFEQTVSNAQRRTTQTTSGTFAFARPGKFRWTYEKPFDQLIVGDGASVVGYMPVSPCRAAPVQRGAPTSVPGMFAWQLPTGSSTT